jgi:hypothetical protein
MTIHRGMFCPVSKRHIRAVYRGRLTCTDDDRPDSNKEILEDKDGNTESAS